MRFVRLLTVSALALLIVTTAACSLVAPAPSVPWPPSSSGRPTFYYFGDPG